MSELHHAYEEIYAAILMGAPPIVEVKQLVDGSLGVRWGVDGLPMMSCSAIGARGIASTFFKWGFLPALSELLQQAADFIDQNPRAGVH